MKKMNVKKIGMLTIIILVIAIVTWIGTGFINQKHFIPPQETQRQITHRVVSPREAYALIQDNKDNSNFAILDVRTPEEFEEGYIENAINIDYYMDERTNYTESFREELDKLDKEKTYLVYCLVDIRSRTALEIMEHLGFREVYDMSGGFVQWKAEEFPITE